MLLAAWEAWQGRRLDNYGLDLIRRFTVCTPEKPIDAEIEIDLKYYIGLMPRWDHQEIGYRITNLGDSPIRSKHFNLGRTTGSERLKSFASLMKLRITACAGDANLAVVPYKMQQDRLDIFFSLDSDIQKGQTKEIAIVIPRRVGLWDSLRRTGEDTGSYTLAQTPPKRLTISIEPPPGYAQDIQLVPQGVTEDIIAEARRTGTWDVDTLLPGHVCQYRVTWGRRPNAAVRLYKSLRLGIGLP